MRNVAIAASVLALAAVPAAAEGATFFNSSPAKGGYVITASRTIQTLQVFCVGSGYQNRELRFDAADQIDIGRSGKFSYSGTGYSYGPEGEPRGSHKVKFSGHLNGSKSISIKWKLPGCGSGVSVASVQR